MHKQKNAVTLIVDGHSTHKTKLVKEYIQKTNGKLKLYYLPPYSPELNPDEFVWNNAKQKVAKRKHRQDDNKATFEEKVEATLKSIQKNMALVISFYGDKNVAYAM